ncbi:hypothetical protein HK098_001176 [Nowakowskiella sp. JEL0407]|nr:hypothetical protein HK098_001176 [Nowakowskiella sp. JEL0407]
MESQRVNDNIESSPSVKKHGKTRKKKSHSSKRSQLKVKSPNSDQHVVLDKSDISYSSMETNSANNTINKDDTDAINSHTININSAIFQKNEVLPSDRAVNMRFAEEDNGRFRRVDDKTHDYQNRASKSEELNTVYDSSSSSVESSTTRRKSKPPANLVKNTESTAEVRKQNKDLRRLSKDLSFTCTITTKIINGMYGGMCLASLVLLPFMTATSTTTLPAPGSPIPMPISPTVIYVNGTKSFKNFDFQSRIWGVIPPDLKDDEDLSQLIDPYGIRCLPVTWTNFTISGNDSSPVRYASRYGSPCTIFPTKWDTSVEFIALYSPVAFIVGLIFNVMAVVCTIDALETVIPENLNFENWKRVAGLFKGLMILRVLAVSASLISSVLIVPIDDRLDKAYADKYGSIYGQLKW